MSTEPIDDVTDTVVALSAKIRGLILDNNGAAAGAFAEALLDTTRAYRELVETAMVQEPGEDE